jgi:hypothetical protein
LYSGRKNERNYPYPPKKEGNEMSKKSKSKRIVQQGADRLAAEDRASMSMENKERKQQDEENRTLGGV